MATSLPPVNPLRILLVGDSKTGKHSYVSRLLHNRFSYDAWTNKECEISSITVKIDEDKEIPIQLLNIQGSERGKTKLKQYFKNIDGYIIMFDVTRAETYDDILNWKDIVDKENLPKKVPRILLANKCDLEKDEGLSREMDGLNIYCQATGFCAYFETSNKTNLGIEQSIQRLIREILTPSIPDPEPAVPVPQPSVLDSQPREHKFKISLIGDLGTGKTALMQRYTHNTFSGNYQSTIGVGMDIKKTRYHNSIISISIWDVAGNERYGNMTRLFYRDTVGCLVVFDVSKPSTLDGAIRWKMDFDNKVNFDKDNQIPCLLVGNKCDLVKEGIVNSQEHMIEFCQTHGFNRWFETSAKTNTNIAETFSFLIQEIMKNIDVTTDVTTESSSGTIRISDTSLSRPTAHVCCKS